jgi:hypothetical protein
MNPLRKHASTRTKEDIKSIRRVYLDLDHGGQEALNSVENSNAVPKPNYVLTSSPGKFQIVWKVEGMGLREAEGLLRAMARECGGDPAATDATRVLRLPDFANKKYETNFFVEVRKVSERIYRLRDFKLNIDAQDSPSYTDHERVKRASSSRTNLSQSEHDWAFAKRALARGEPLEDVIRRIAQYRAAFKSNPLYYARHTVMKVAKLFRQNSSTENKKDGRRDRKEELPSSIEVERVTLIDAYRQIDVGHESGNYRSSASCMAKSRFTRACRRAVEGISWSVTSTRYSKKDYHSSLLRPSTASK